MIIIEAVELPAILPLRMLYLAEMNTQIRYNACHERAWSDSYLISRDTCSIGYICVKGLNDLSKRNTVFEYYLLPADRKDSRQIFDTFRSQHQMTHIEAQSNDLFLCGILSQVSKKTTSSVLLYEYSHIVNRQIPEVIFRKVSARDNVFGKKKKDTGQFVLEFENHIVADGGFLLHYNAPFADIYMETGKDYQNRGFGSYMVQELIKECFRQHRIPAARCNTTNYYSQRTLTNGGLKLAGSMLVGKL